MAKKELSQIRQQLGKTQRHMAQLLGASPIAIQSFEAGMAEYSRTDGTLGAFSHGPERCSGQKGPTLVGHKELS
jgi:transcriptional regulator with XRE-family HTH domain